ncbi:YwiC-like family protein [Bacillus sp. P14.5]|uniref:YwiC-like family protein n=1 Tax=Bacillus sp. P14.5 TaxID=1983400 RepID=UPI000DEBDE15|nr:YwiC-like family protein [Bacillus sp. P14.5]
MKPLLPKQHGAWAMLLVPFILGISESSFELPHIPLLIGWLFLYLATYPMLMLVKGKKKSEYVKWSAIYLGISMFMLVTVLLFDWRMLYFGVAMIPFFLVNIYFAKKKKERAFTNDVIAIIEFCIGGLASFYLGSGEIDIEGWSLLFYSFLFFLGSTFFVKTMIREKKNKTFRLYSWGYHLSLLAMMPIFSPAYLMVIPFIPSVVRAFVLYGRKLSIMQLGISEIINSAFFLVSMIILL